jgi:hypothetical protein
MHRCLQVDEVVARICDKLSRRSALALALTNKALFEPAMDHCWRDLTSFWPLVSCLPEDLLEEEPVVEDSNRPSRMMVRDAFYFHDTPPLTGTLNSICEGWYLHPTSRGILSPTPDGSALFDRTPITRQSIGCPTKPSKPSNWLLAGNPGCFPHC